MPTGVADVRCAVFEPTWVVLWTSTSSAQRRRLENVRSLGRVATIQPGPRNLSQNHIVWQPIGLRCQDAWVATGPYVRCDGKGRKQRCTPLAPTTAQILRTWRGPDRPRLSRSVILFCTRNGHELSRDAVEHLMRKYTTIATGSYASLAGKKISPHVLSAKVGTARP